MPISHGPSTFALTPDSRDAVRELIRFLWRHDHHEFIHPRDRVQLALILQLLWSTDTTAEHLVRCGAFRGLLYEQVQFLALRDGDRRRFAAKISLRTQSTQQIHVVSLLEDQEDRDTSPLETLLALAISDGALAHVKSTDDLRAMRVSPGEAVQPIAVAENMKNVSVLRTSSSRGHRVPVHTWLQSRRFEVLMTQLIDRAGLKARLHTSIIRYGVVSDGLPSSNNDRSTQHLLSCLESPSLGHWTPRPKELYGIRRDRTALPSPLSTRPVEVCLQWDEPRDMISRLYYHGVVDHRLNIEAVVKPLCDLICTGHLPWRYSFTRILDTGQCGNCEVQLSHSWTHQNGHLLSCFLSQREESSQRNMLSLVQSSHGACRWAGCSTDLKRLSLAHFGAHIQQHLWVGGLRCYWDSCVRSCMDYFDLHMHLFRDHHLPVPGLLPELHYCFQCRQQVETATEWEYHCADHIRCLSDLFCGLITRRGVIVLAAQCVFCMGDCSLPASRRWTQFKSLNGLHLHLARYHVARSAWTGMCPHPLCQFRPASEEMFWLHLHNVHGIPPSRRHNTTPTNTDADTSSKHAIQHNESSCGHPSNSPTSDQPYVEDSVIIADATYLSMKTVSAKQIHLAGSAKRPVAAEDRDENSSRKRRRVVPDSEDTHLDVAHICDPKVLLSVNPIEDSGNHSTDTRHIKFEVGSIQEQPFQDHDDLASMTVVDNSDAALSDLETMFADFIHPSATNFDRGSTISCTSSRSMFEEGRTASLNGSVPPSESPHNDSWVHTTE